MAAAVRRSARVAGAAFIVDAEIVPISGKRTRKDGPHEGGDGESGVGGEGGDEEGGEGGGEGSGASGGALLSFQTLSTRKVGASARHASHCMLPPLPPCALILHTKAALLYSRNDSAST